MEEAKGLLSDVTFEDGAYAAIKDADAVVIITEWDEFRALDMARVKEALATPILIDLRNIYQPMQMAKFGFDYVSVGRV